MIMDNGQTSTLESLQFWAKTLTRTIQDIPEDAWLRRPDACTNHMLWIVGHIVVMRGRMLRLAGSTWSAPAWDELFVRGSALAEAEQYPSVAELVADWKDLTLRVPEALRSASTETLDAAAPAGIPSFDGKVSGVLAFLSTHEAYHVGQVTLLRTWLNRTAY